MKSQQPKIVLGANFRKKCNVGAHLRRTCSWVCGETQTILERWDGESTFARFHGLVGFDKIIFFANCKGLGQTAQISGGVAVGFKRKPMCGVCVIGTTELGSYAVCKRLPSNSNAVGNGNACVRFCLCKQGANFTAVHGET